MALELLKGKEDWDTQAKFIGTALANFDPEGLRVAREFGADDLPGLHRQLIATAILTGEDLPELEQLREKERERWAEVRRRQEWLSNILVPAAKPRPAAIAQAPAIVPVRSGKKVGRNDPCPCGSGKKSTRSAAWARAEADRSRRSSIRLRFGRRMSKVSSATMGMNLLDTAPNKFSGMVYRAHDVCDCGHRRQDQGAAVTLTARWFLQETAGGNPTGSYETTAQSAVGSRPSLRSACSSTGFPSRI